MTNESKYICNDKQKDFVYEPIAIKGIGNIKPKKTFEERYKKLLGSEYDIFMKYSLSYLRNSIRVNTLKISVEDLKKRLIEKDVVMEQIPWCPEGFWVYGDRRDYGNLLEHSLGYIYIQEAMSMVPPVVLDPQPGDNILDMCAAPGSKTTQIAQYMKQEGTLVANDYTPVRARPLGLNIQRLGIHNCMLTLMKGQNFARLDGEFFDKILVDAPCSGTGTIRKSLKTLTQTSDGFIKKLSREQKKLAETAFNLLKPGGTMVYSTCSLEPWENEEVVSYLLETFPNASTGEINLPGMVSADPITEFEGNKYHEGVKNCLRVYPHQNDTDGFFVTKIIKSE